MKIKTLSIVTGVALAGFLGYASPAFAQAGRDQVDRVSNWKEDISRQKDADAALAKKGATTGLLQKELDKLAERKTQVEKEVDYCQAKFNDAARKYKASQLAGSPEEQDKWNREATAWDTRLKASKDELVKIDSDIQLKIKEIQKLYTSDSPTSNIIVPGDALQLFVLEDESFNGLYQVRRGGYIILPRVGRVSVVGRDVTGVEKAVKEALEASQLRQATVMIERTRGTEDEGGGVIYLAGEFNTPGPLKIPVGFSPTLVTTVLRSGGVSQSADLTRVKLLRLESGKGLVEEVNVQAILDGSGLQSDLALNPGDIVVIPAFAPVVYVTGNVQKPGTLRLFQDEDLTAYSAILRSGGFARFASLKKVYVIRDYGNGEKAKIPVNIKDVQAGKIPDVVLRGKDIVVVPERFFSF